MTKDKKVLIKWTIGVLILLIVILTVLYHIPIHRHIDVTMYDDGGNPSVMQMELTISRSVFSISKPKIQGTVIFEGRQYQSIPYYEKRHAYYFIDTEQLSKGGTIIDLIQNALYFPFIDYNFVPSGSSDLTENYLLMLQTIDGEGTTWRSYIQDS